MQLQDLFKPLDELTEEELRKKLQEIRHNRTVERPAAKARAKRESNKGRSAKISKAESLLAGLTPEQIKELMDKLGG